MVATYARVAFEQCWHHPDGRRLRTLHDTTESHVIYLVVRGGNPSMKDAEPDGSGFWSYIDTERWQQLQMAPHGTICLTEAERFAPPAAPLVLVAALAQEVDDE